MTVRSTMARFLAVHRDVARSSNRGLDLTLKASVKMNTTCVDEVIHILQSAA
jgi:hypothetical protein